MQQPASLIRSLKQFVIQYRMVINMLLDLFSRMAVVLLNNYLSDPAAFKAASEQEQLVVHRLLDFIGDEGICSVFLLAT